MIKVENLVKRYGTHLAVDHLSFEVEKGEILGFLGPNGAGKSTTMNMITGYISCNEGTIEINGHDMFKEPEIAKRFIGYLPEQPPVYYDMTVLEYLQFVAELKKVEKSKRATMIQEIMDSTKLLDVSGRLIRHLSKGYKQRVGIAGTLIGYPEVIILDESTVGLDPKQIIEIRDLIKKLSTEHTVILSSHILAEISAVCDHILIINKGKLIANDTPENLTRYYEHSDILQMVIKGSKEKVDKVFALISDIEQVEYKEETKGSVHVEVYAKEHTDIREQIFYALAKAECPIYEMNLMKQSLEDIFLKLTQNESEGEE